MVFVRRYGVPSPDFWGEPLRKLGADAVHLEKVARQRTANAAPKPRPPPDTGKPMRGKFPDRLTRNRTLESDIQGVQDSIQLERLVGLGRETLGGETPEEVREAGHIVRCFGEAEGILRGADPSGLTAPDLIRLLRNLDHGRFSLDKLEGFHGYRDERLKGAIRSFPEVLGLFREAREKLARDALALLSGSLSPLEVLGRWPWGDYSEIETFLAPSQWRGVKGELAAYERLFEAMTKAEKDGPVVLARFASLLYRLCEPEYATEAEEIEYQPTACRNAMRAAQEQIAKAGTLPPRKQLAEAEKLFSGLSEELHGPFGARFNDYGELFRRTRDAAPKKL